MTNPSPPANRGSTLPCPFCGCTPSIEPWHGGRSSKRLIECVNDDCEVQPSVTGATESQAVTKWNARAPIKHGPQS